MSGFNWTEDRLVAATGASAERSAQGGPDGFCSDSRSAKRGDLFIGIPGARVDGGTLAGEALREGAWGVLVTPEALAAIDLGEISGCVLVHPDPVAALGLLAAERRRILNVPVIGVTGSTGKTSTKDVLGALLGRQGEVFVSSGNRNTEVGLPLELLAVPESATAVVLEMAMRAEGEIADLARIASPDAGIIVNVGPVHLETLGSIERVAAAKAELIGALRPGSVAVTPAGDSLLEPYMRDDLVNITFGPAGDARLEAVDGRTLTMSVMGQTHVMEVDFDQPHNRLNLLAAAAVATGLGFELPQSLRVGFSGLRGQRKALEDGVIVIDDCYNANPMSMSAALADLAGEQDRRGGRAVAVLGDMLELGPDSSKLHRELGRAAADAGVGLLITVGVQAAEAVGHFDGVSVAVDTADQAATELKARLAPGDTVLVKGSRGVGLELVLQSLEADGG